MQAEARLAQRIAAVDARDAAVQRREEALEPVKVTLENQVRDLQRRLGAAGAELATERAALTDERRRSADLASLLEGARQALVSERGMRELLRASLDAFEQQLALTTEKAVDAAARKGEDDRKRTLMVAEHYAVVGKRVDEALQGVDLRKIMKTLERAMSVAGEVQMSTAQLKDVRRAIDGLRKARGDLRRKSPGVTRLRAGR